MRDVQQGGGLDSWRSLIKKGRTGFLMDLDGEAEGGSRKPPRPAVWALGSWRCHAPCWGAQEQGQFNRKMFLVGVLDP